MVLDPWLRWADCSLPQHAVQFMLMFMLCRLGIRMNSVTSMDTLKHATPVYVDVDVQKSLPR
jgi:hypothetical protein